MKNVFEIEKSMNEIQLPFLKLNLQHFAEDGEGQGEGGAAGSGEGEDSGQGQGENKITLTEEELLKKIESEADKKLDKALKTARAKWEEEFKAKLEEEKREAERLAKLSEKERKEEELRKREENIERRLRELERKELRADAAADLTEKGLPVSFVDFILAENAEKTLENINTFKKAFDEAVAEKVKEALAGTPPKKEPNNNAFKNPFNAEYFNLTAQGKLIREKPELAKQLIIQAGGNPAIYGL